MEAEEQLIHRLINSHRQKQYLPALALHSLLSEEARWHSRRMADRKIQPGHAGFKTRARRIRANLLYRQLTENVAWNFGYTQPSQRAVSQWLRSRRHRHNLEGDYHFTGIGVVRSRRGRYYFTQIFLNPL